MKQFKKDQSVIWKIRPPSGVGASSLKKVIFDKYVDEEQAVVKVLRKGRITGTTKVLVKDLEYLEVIG